MTDTQNVILTIPQAAERYQLPGITIYIAMRRGEIESYRHGQQWFIYSKSLEMWLGNRRNVGDRIKMASALRKGRMPNKKGECNV